MVTIAPYVSNPQDLDNVGTTINVVSDVVNFNSRELDERLRKLEMHPVVVSVTPYTTTTTAVTTGGVDPTAAPHDMVNSLLGRLEKIERRLADTPQTQMNTW